MNRILYILIFSFTCFSFQSFAQIEADTIRKDLNSIVDLDNSYLNFEDQLSGKISGVKITRRSGLPGEGSNVSFSGFKSLIQSDRPLYVIDGTLYDVQSKESPVIEGFVNNILAEIDANDIESIEILKGAAALKYGSQSGRGVVVIKTKNNNSLVSSILFNSVLSVNTLYRQKEVLNADNFNSYAINLMQSKFELSEIESAHPYLFYNGDDVGYNNFNQNTNWQDEVYNTSVSQNYNLQVKGGDAVAKYFLSVGYLNDKGIVVGTDYEKYNMRFNSNINVTKDFTIDVNATLSEFKNNVIESGYNFNNNPLISALTRSPILGSKQVDSKGVTQLAYSQVYGLGVSNPNAILNDNITYSKGNYITTGVGFNYKFNDKLSTNLRLALNSINNTQNNFISGKSSKAIAPIYYYNKYADNMTKQFISRRFVTQIDYALNYKNDKLLKGIDTQIGFRYKGSDYEDDFAVGINTPNDNFVTLNQASKNDIRTTLGSFYGYKLIQYHANSTINITSKLDAELYLSIDGNSNVGENTDKYGVFYGGDLNYQVYNNPESIILNQLNVTASYLKSANTDIGNDMTNRYFVSTPFVNIAGLKPYNIANTRLKWEDVYSTQLSMSANLFKVLQLDLTAYQNEIKDMVVFRKLDDYTGFKGMFVNGGEMKSTGYNVAISTNFKVNKLRANIYANVGSNIEEIRSLPDNKAIITEIHGGQLISEVGSAGYQFYGYQMEGVIATQQEANDLNLASEDGNLLQAGDIRFTDLNNDHVINAKDRTVIGDPNSDLFGGFGLVLDYKKLSLDLNFSYSSGNDVYNYSRKITEGQSSVHNQTSNVLNAWVKDGDITDVPRLNYGDPSFNNSFSSRFIEDGSYVKLSNLKISYDIGISNNVIRSLTAYVSGHNLWFTSKYSGYDPEFSYSDNPVYQGVDYGKTPNPQSFILGLQIGL